jgi:transposase, IS30 family
VSGTGYNLPPRRDVQRAFWRLIRQGRSVEDASACLGLGSTTGERWFRQAGGMSPLGLDSPACSFRLTIEEREVIAAGIARDRSYRAIAADLGRPPSTVWREVRRNLHHQRYRPRCEVAKVKGPGPPRTTPIRYSPSTAQRRADFKAARPKTAKLAVNARLHDEVQARLEAKNSPEQISRRLRLDFPDEAEMQVSHEAIYQALYVQGRGGLRRELHTCLRTGRAIRRPRRHVGQRRGKIPNMVMISERPAEVADRAVPGHWEGDLITGTANKSAIGTLVERTTRFTMLLHLPDGHGALAVQEAMIEAMGRLPQFLRKTLTWDQGREMTNHAQIAAATDLDIYFCDPHSPWLRGSNENTNGLLRQYFPKGTDLSIYPAHYLDHVAAELNNRPRKTLDWATPAEALDRLLSEATNPPGVAITG